MSSTVRTSGENPFWRLVAWALIVVGVCLRIADLRWMQYGGEQEEILRNAYAALRTLGAPHGLRVSNGIVMPPFFIDLMALPLAFTQDPVRIAAFIAVLNLVGLILFHVFVHRFLGPRTALWTSVLLVSMPWAVLSSRKIWAQDCVFPFTAALLLLLFSNMQEYRRWKTWLGFAVLGLWSQIYPSTWFLIPSLLVFCVLFRMRIPLGDLLGGIAIAALLFARWIVFQVSTGFDDIAWFLHGGNPGREGAMPVSRRSLEALWWPLRGTNSAGFDSITGADPGAGILSPAMTSAVGVLNRVAMVLTAGAILYALAWSATRVRSHLRKEAIPLRDRVIVYASLTMLMVVGAYAFLALPPVAHYHAVLLPVVALLLVTGLERLPPIVGAAPVIPALALANLLFLWRFEAAVKEHPETVSRVYGPPYAALETSWRKRLADQFDEILHGNERARAAQEELGRKFESAGEVLLRIDPTRNEPAIEPVGRITVESTSEGLAVRGGSPLEFLSLPPIEAPAGSTPVLRIDLTCPLASALVVLYGTREHPEIARGRMRDMPAPRGRSTLYLQLPDAGITGRMLLRLSVYHFAIHALEIRAVRP